MEPVLQDGRAERDGGYLHRTYAESFSDVATACELPASGGWLLERSIPGSDLRDATGCYPLFCCRDWTRLGDDVPALRDRLVSITIVTDPFGTFDQDDLRRSFDVVRPHKPQYVTDLSTGVQLPRSKSHRRNVDRALNAVLVQTVTDPLRYADTWVDLHRHLAMRRRLSGFGAPSPRCLRRQLAVPGSRLFVALAGGTVVAAHLWYVQGNVAYAHLGASSDRGYELRASFALEAFAVQQLAADVRWLMLGSAPGSRADALSCGLARYKQGWATDLRDTYLCGRILQPRAYERLVEEQAAHGSERFPAYRNREGFGSASTAEPPADEAPEPPS